MLITQSISKCFTHMNELTLVVSHAILQMGKLRHTTALAFSMVLIYKSFSKKKVVFFSQFSFCGKWFLLNKLL